VLTDDNFATIVEAIREGRRIYDNLRRSFAYLLAFHVPVVSLALAAPVLGLPLLLLPVELVFLELMLHPTVAVVFQAEPAAPNVMARPPRSPAAALMTLREAIHPLLLGVSLSAVTLALFAGAPRWGASVEQARGLAFACLVIGQGLLVVTERTPQTPFWRASYRGQRALLPALAASALALALLIHVPVIAHAFHLSPLGLKGWGVALGGAMAATLWGEWAWKVRPSPA